MNKIISVDHFSKMGSSHKICEDYIISENNYIPVPYVILSDGCSSSQNTDIGARILTHLTKQYLLSQSSFFNLNSQDMSNWIIYNAENIVKTMGLNKSCLDATLIISYIVNDDVYVYMYGDGFLITIDLNNEIRFSKISYKNSAPYYLSYQINSYRNELYKKSNPKKRLTNKYTCYTWLPYENPFLKKLKCEDFKGIFIASDGLDSFINKDGEKQNIEKIMKEITSFKNTNGEFIKRRMGSKKGVINNLKEKEFTHYDDISIGGFFFREY